MQVFPLCRWGALLLTGAALLLTVQPAQAQPPDQGAYRFTKIPIRHYDARVIAELMTQPAGIVVVPPNFVIPATSLTPAAPTLTAPTPVAPSAAAPKGVSVLPEGVRRIFVLESDNSLVIEATSDGLARLSLDSLPQ